MSETPTSIQNVLDNLKAVIAKHWGFPSLRPLQEHAMRHVLEGRDTVVVMPTGGGKSLCYQAPAMVRGDTTVVVSPLISLMKDQVDGLQACGVPAIQIDSSQTPEERFAFEMDIRQGAVRLVFVSPERLVTANFTSLLRQLDVRTFAIDEAHCISHWGHDFRPEYRQLIRLRKEFPNASFHAYTATATQHVRDDIVKQLGLVNPQVLVGNFDRPNLTYRVFPRTDVISQVREVLERHRNEAGIIYCIRRKNVDEVTAALRADKYDARPYHAGMTPEQRKSTQEAFAQEECDLVVATVAFGMGIDRSNIRYVLHTGMPKSIEHYQQETGRAGRDGLEAECVLLHSGADFMTWKFIIEKSAQEELNQGKQVEPDFVKNSLQHVNDMSRYCTGAVCRHKALVEYFGQTFPAPECSACDICLGDVEIVADAVVVAQKILSCVARVKESFGINHVAQVLQGSAGEAITRRGHDKLSTYGLLKDHPRPVILNWIRQLIGQGVLVQAGDEYPILKLNAASWEVMRKERTIRLLQPVGRKKDARPQKSKADIASWEGVDNGLFDGMRQLRRKLAEKQNVAPFHIFSDHTLRELARIRPSSLDRMRLVYGIGDVKLRDFGALFLNLIQEHCEANSVKMDMKAAAPQRSEPAKPSSGTKNASKSLSYKLFKEGTAIEDVMHRTQRSRSTVMDYLSDFIREERPKSVRAWVADDLYQEVAKVAREAGLERLKPIFIALGEKVPYEVIRLVVAHLETNTV